MSIRQGLLALLSHEPMYGAQLRTEFERRTGGTWPLNVGQVYTTLGRLQRDGLVEPEGEADEEGRIVYRLTAQGRTAVGEWFTSSVSPDSEPRDELTIKVAMGISLPDVDVTAVVQAQRADSLRHLQALTRLKRDALDKEDLARELVLERSIFATEAQVRWLDHMEARIRRARRRTTNPVEETAR
ncbi:MULTISPECIES: PadR family transcriptional regulator [Mumia]|uniref:PadR family transcriptional regulator n=1 Tax=Mumia TaxID=1546255 RepID=UPI0014232741|nr:MULTISPECIES: PadR family transcriptional regulator [unclassified Mumia]QMW67040.1 PadR family transcriptional regulator [Mumia sp. ZJ1417]